MTKQNRLLHQSNSVDFRSDTVTKPTPSMLEAMIKASLGDDVYSDDPSVNELEGKFAHMIGKERCVFFPSGTQSNLAAILVHCARGDEILVGENYHTFGYEAGGASALGGIVYKPLKTLHDGSLDYREIDKKVNPDNPHFPESRLLCLENTVHGKPIPVDTIQKCSKVAKKNGLRVHLDGARLFNATTQFGVDPKDYTKEVDTVSICLSKGLGAPAGTLLGCTKSMERSIRRNRKLLGGGMRQTGILAAAGLYAIKHNIKRIEQDHKRAQKLHSILKELNDWKKAEVSCYTNMVFFRPQEADHEPLRIFLESRGFLVANKKPIFRFVIHLDINDNDIEHFGSTIRAFYSK